ncbi:hypothetical protein BH10BAC4_BH10BAC4_16130 [soil metagenome]
MKHSLIILFSLTATLGFANMASPIREGTYSSSAFSSRDIDILKEKIYLTIDKNFATASYIIEYFIKTDKDGKQIPLLFHAKDYRDDFKVWIDNHEVKLLTIPEGYKTTNNSFLRNFSNSVDTPSADVETVTIYWDKTSGYVYNLLELKYFEADLTKGEHTVRVEYTADVWIDVSDWVTEYSFRYSLSPAKNWRSFGSLEIILNGNAFNGFPSTNIGKPTIAKPDSTVWNFSKLPADYLIITHTPPISKLATKMIALGPEGVTAILALLIALLHFFGIKKYRKQEPTKRYSWVVIAGSIIIPLLILVIYLYSYDLIDSIIGESASRYHGYTFLAIILYPILLPVYWVIMWLIDRIIRGRINKSLA